MQAGNVPKEFLAPDKFKEKAYIKDGETVRLSTCTVACRCLRV